MSLTDLFELNKNAQISPEAAGAGFAIAVTLAKKYHRQETSSIPVLQEAGIPLTDQEENQLEDQKPNKKSDIQAAEPSENKSKPELYQSVLKLFLSNRKAGKNATFSNVNG
jgi:hypothetical protein